MSSVFLNFLIYFYIDFFLSILYSEDTPHIGGKKKIMQGKKIKSILIYKDKSITELAADLDKSPQNLSNLLKKDNFRESELKEIAAALDCNLDIKFIDKSTGRIY